MNSRLKMKLKARKMAQRKAKFEQAFSLLDRANTILHNIEQECEKQGLHK